MEVVKMGSKVQKSGDFFLLDFRIAWSIATESGRTGVFLVVIKYYPGLAINRI